jgi:hypothetical protein
MGRDGVGLRPRACAGHRSPPRVGGPPRPHRWRTSPLRRCGPWSQCSAACPIAWGTSTVVGPIVVSPASSVSNSATASTHARSTRARGDVAHNGHTANASEITVSPRPASMIITVPTRAPAGSVSNNRVGRPERSVPRAHHIARSNRASTPCSSSAACRPVIPSAQDRGRRSGCGGTPPRTGVQALVHRRGAIAPPYRWVAPVELCC